MQKVFIAFVFCVLFCTVYANSSTKKDFYTNFMNSNRSNDVALNSLSSNPPEVKSNEFFNKYIENVRNKNKQMNLKMVQNLNNQSQNGNYTKLREKLRRQMMNMTASRQDNTPEFEAPTMIPIFRPLQNNIRNKPQPGELIRTDENVSKDSETFNNTQEYDREFIYLKTLAKDESEDDSVNSTNGVEILQVDTIGLLKQHQKALNFQQVNLKEPINNEVNPLQPTINIGVGKDHIVSSEIQEKVLELKDIVYPNNIFADVQSMFIPNTEIIGGNNAVAQSKDFKIHPQFKIEYIPANNKLSLNQNTQNLITLSESLNPSTDDINTIQNVITENLGLPNNIIIESMKFVPLSEMQNNLRNPQSVFQYPSIETELENSANNKLSLNQNTQNLITLSESLNPSTDDINTIQNVITQNLGLPNNMIIESMKFVPLSEMQNNLRNPQSVFQYPSIETELEKQIFKENAAMFQRDYDQTNPVTSNTRFEIPCFTATDILEDFGRYNPTPNQNTVQSIIYSETEDVNTNFPCTNEAGKDNIDDESLAIIFKPKNISLLKLYGDILKKITLTVLVPYHVSKVVA